MQEFVQPSVWDEDDPFGSGGEILLELVLGSGMRDQGDVDATCEQKPKEMVWDRRFAAETHGGVFGNQDDPQRGGISCD